MASTETRMLILGAVSYFEPVNGYQVQRELLTWGLDEASNTTPGSIYSMLRTLSRQGHLDRHEVVDGGRRVSVYTTTSSGRQLFLELVRTALATVTPLAPLAMHLAFNFAPLVERATFTDCIRARRATLLERCEELTERLTTVDEGTHLPPHIRPSVDLMVRSAGLELEWLDELLAHLDAGGLRFRGEEPTWRPPAEDSGWQMVADQERYRALLGLS
jgi:DNA-binding PadR family transcriptional regulator